MTKTIKNMAIKISIGTLATLAVVFGSLLLMVVTGTWEVSAEKISITNKIENLEKADEAFKLVTNEQSVTNKTLEKELRAIKENLIAINVTLRLSDINFGDDHKTSFLP